MKTLDVKKLQSLPTQEWMDELRTNAEERKRAIEQIYHQSETLRIIKSMLRRYGCRPDELMDVVQQAVLKLNEQLAMGKFKGESSLTNYFIGIVKGICRNWSRMKCRTVLLCEHYFMDSVCGSGNLSWEVLEEECRNLLQKELSRMKGRKLAVLQMWLEGYKMREIAECLDLGNEVNARKWKYRATQELIANIKEEQETYQALKKFWFQAV